MGIVSLETRAPPAYDPRAEPDSSEVPAAEPRAELACKETPTGQALAPRSPFFLSPENALLLLAGDLHAAEPSFAAHPLTTDDHPRFAWLGPRLARARERLIGFPFLDWIGKRYLRPRYPSCDLGATPPEQVLNSIRAGNFYFAAAAASAVLPGDARPEQVRWRQVAGYLEKARALSPEVRLPEEALGR